MELTPQTVRATSFKTVKKGYDPDEVDTFRDEAAAAIEAAQNQAAAMEARARAAVAKLQELSQQPAAPAPAAAAAAGVAASPDDAETISRTLLLAQRTADTTVAEARAEAEAIVTAARAEAGAQIDSARSMATRLIDEARQEARRAGEDERLRADNEVQALLAKRDFLVSDVDHLEQYLGSQRERVRDVAAALHELAERTPDGLGDMRRPILSASAEPPLAPVAAVAPIAPAMRDAAPEPEPVLEPAAALPDMAEIVAAVEAEALASPLSLAASSTAAADHEVTAATDPWSDTADAGNGDGVGEPTPARPELDFSLDVTAEVPVTPAPNPLRLRIGDDTQ